MIEMGVIPAGTTLWHGTGAEVGFVVPRGPSWFSDAHAVAWHFAWLRAGWSGPVFPSRVMKFVVTKDIELPVITNRAVRGTGRRPDFENEVWTTKQWGAFVNTVPDRDGTMRGLVQRVCRRYNGWRVVNNYDVGDDIMLCDPSRFVRRVQRGGRR